MQLLFLSTGIHPMLAFGIPSGPDLIILLVIVLVLFGAKRLPELARGLGQSVNEFKKAKDEFDKEVAKPASGDSATLASNSNVAATTASTAKEEGNAP
jgi:sec-independent protein translocase protein TatA